MKKEVNAKRDEQKQESDEKRTEEKLVRKQNTKKCFVSREIHFKNTEEFFFKEGKKEIAGSFFFTIKTYKIGVLFAKMLFLKGRE